MRRPCRSAGALPRNPRTLRTEIERCRASLVRSLKRESAGLARLLSWSLETLATKADIASLREEIRQLRRPR
jgi:hypothetical protein